MIGSAVEVFASNPCPSAKLSALFSHVQVICCRSLVITSRYIYGIHWLILLLALRVLSFLKKGDLVNRVVSGSEKTCEEHRRRSKL